MSDTEREREGELAELLREVRALRHALEKLSTGPAVRIRPAFPPDYEVLVRTQSAFPPEYEVAVRPSLVPEYEVAVQPSLARERVVQPIAESVAEEPRAEQ